MKTWLLCESCIYTESSSSFPKYDLIRECSECAQACFAVVSRLVSCSGNMGDLVFNCLLHCRQCAEECEKYYGDQDIELCGNVCAVCADTLMDITGFSLN